MCRPATRASAWRAWSNGSTASTWERSVPASTRRPSASSRSRPAVGGERFAGDAPLQPGGQARQDYGDHPAAVADRADGLVAGLAPGAVQQQAGAAGNRGPHLLGPLRGVVVDCRAGAQAPQVVMVARAGHASGRRK